MSEEIGFIVVEHGDVTGGNSHTWAMDAEDAAEKWVRAINEENEFFMMQGKNILVDVYGYKNENPELVFLETFNASADLEIIYTLTPKDKG